MTALIFERILGWAKRIPDLPIYGILFNAAYLLAYVFLPLEGSFWKSVIARRATLYPHVDFSNPKAGDIIRIVLQTVFLIFFGVFNFKRFTKSNPVARLALGAVHLAGRFGDFVGGIGTKLLSGIGSNYAVSRRAQRSVSPGIQKMLQTALIILAVLLAMLCITQPFPVGGQVVFLSVVLFSAWILTHAKARVTLMLLFVLSVTVSGRYLWWRYTSTINAESAIGLFLSHLLLAAETYAFTVMVLGYFQVCWGLDRRPRPLPRDRSKWPKVDIFIPTYNESLEIIKPTVFAALNLDWPADKLRVYLLDDGSRESFEAFATEAGAGYIKREEHNHAKAGNINNALKVTDGEFIVIFDCDHVPSSDFLTSTVGWLVRDGRIALVQTPHHFYSPDPFEKNLHLERTMPIENSLFHDFIQKGNDTWNAVMFCGSSAVMRRVALNEIGGIAVETVTEDAHTSLKLNRLGWKSAFISKPVASGLSTESLSAHVGQRIRWARGMVQIFRLDNPFFGKGLTLPQRLCFLNAMIHFLHGLPRIVFLLAPLPYMFFDIYVIYATAAAIFAYVIPHMVHATITNQILQKGYRFPFLGAVYETVLSWYILIPTTIALIFPHKGKFNVTAKGVTIDKKYVDWAIAAPVLVLMALNAAGLAFGIFKTITAADPQVSTLIINIGWIVYNLLILGAAFGVAVEEVQQHRLPRVPLRANATVTTPDGMTFECQTEEFSQRKIVLRTKVPAVGQTVRFALESSDRTDAFEGRVLKTENGLCEIEVIFAGIPDEKRFNFHTFARSGHWAESLGEQPDDCFATGLKRLIGFSAYGYRSLIEFFPSYIGRLLRFVASLLPRLPAEQTA